MFQIKLFMMGAAAVVAAGLAIYGYYKSTPQQQQHSYSYSSSKRDKNSYEAPPSSFRSGTSTKSSESSKRPRKKSEPDSCSICLEVLSSKPTFTLVCKHTFHKHCILPWVTGNDSCPICRSQFN